jgi:hypothetical protein
MLNYTAVQLLLHQKQPLSQTPLRILLLLCCHCRCLCCKGKQTVVRERPADSTSTSISSIIMVIDVTSAILTAAAGLQATL